MRSLVALQTLLVVFVLVPASVLGWLGLQAVDGYEAEMREAYQRDLLAVGEVLRAQIPRMLEEEAEDTTQRLQAAGDLIVERMPFESPTRVLEAAREALVRGGVRSLDPLWTLPQVRLGLVDAEGRGLLPRELTSEPAVPTTDRERLLADLRQASDAALFGRGDGVAAVAVWQEARARARDVALRAACDVEAAWVTLRIGGTPEAFARSVERLSGEHGSAVATVAGRAWVLLLLHGHDATRLAGLAKEGLLDEVPLTSQERRRVDDLLAGLGPHERRASALETLVRPLAHGVSLRVLRPDPAHAALLVRVRERVAQLGMPVRVSQAGVPTLVHLATHPTAGTLTHPIEIPRPGRVALAFVLEHGEMDRLRGDVARRRLWTTIGVASLLAVVVLGLLLVRRAVLREREAVRLRDDFLANVSHELRTPLTSVSLHADLLARPDLSAEKRRAHVEVVQAEGARLSALVEDLLDFAALERGARRLAPEPVPVLAAVERALAPYRVLAEQAGVLLALEAAPPAPRELEALVDPQALARILANVVGNAFKHGTPGRDGVRPTVRVCVGTAPGRVLVEVRDNGPGVPPEERAQLFERFRRGRAAGARPGTGLGLALSRGLARAMGGDLVWAEDPRETVFLLTLPSFDATMAPGGEVRA